MTLSPPRAHSTFDMDISDFDISETNADAFRNVGQGQTPQRQDILSPRIATSEVNRHFANFSTNFEHDFTDDSLMDPSIEVGRGKARNLSSYRKNSSDEGSPPSKVTNKPEALYQQPQSTRKVSDGKYDFVIPSAYQDDDSFFGSKAQTRMHQQPKKKNADEHNLPDITGLSSIFSSENGTKKKSSHKQIVSVPLDPDDQALFTAFGSFQKKVEQLEKDKQDMTSRIKSMENELKQVNGKLDGEKQKSEVMERRAKKYKTMAIAMKEQMDKVGLDMDTKISKERQDNESVVKERDEFKGQVENLTAQVEELKRENERLQTGQKQQTAPVSSPQQPAWQPTRQVQFETPDVSKDESTVKSEQRSDLDEIKELLVSLLKERNNNTEPEPVEPEVEAEPELQEPTPLPDYEDSVLDALQQVVEKIKTRSAMTGTTATSTASAVPESAPSTAFDAFNKPAKSARSASTAGAKQRVPKLVDRVLESLPATCQVCSKSAPLNHECSPGVKPQRAKSAPAYPTKEYPHSATSFFPQSEYEWDEQSIRPSMTAEQSIRLILDGMGREYSVLKDQYHELTSDYTGHNPTKQRKRRQQVAESLKSIMNDMEVKADQIYAMYDVMAETNINVKGADWVNGEYTPSAGPNNEYDGDNDTEEDEDDGEGLGILGKHQWIHT